MSCKQGKEVASPRQSVKTLKAREAHWLKLIKQER